MHDRSPTSHLDPASRADQIAQDAHLRNPTPRALKQKPAMKGPQTDETQADETQTNEALAHEPLTHVPLALRNLAVCLLAFQTLALLDRANARDGSAESADVRQPSSKDIQSTKLTLSVRVPDAPNRVVCLRCEVQFLAAGPTGYQDQTPICDACLLENAPELGMILVLVAMARLFSAPPPPSDRGERVSLVELGAFARVYERFASERAPTRGLGAFLRTS